MFRNSVMVDDDNIELHALFCITWPWYIAVFLNLTKQRFLKEPVCFPTQCVLHINSHIVAASCKHIWLTSNIFVVKVVKDDYSESGWDVGVIYYSQKSPALSLIISSCFYSIIVSFYVKLVCVSAFSQNIQPSSLSLCQLCQKKNLQLIFSGGSDRLLSDVVWVVHLWHRSPFRWPWWSPTLKHSIISG